MWKLCPECEDSIEDSTDGKGSTPSSGGGGVSVRVFCRGEALYVSKWFIAGAKGGSEDRLKDAGDCGILVSSVGLWSALRNDLTGVRSRSESASFAEAAASTRSSHLEPVEDVALGGSAEKAFLPSILILLA